MLRQDIKPKKLCDRPQTNRLLILIPMSAPGWRGRYPEVRKMFLVWFWILTVWLLRRTTGCFDILGVSFYRNNCLWHACSLSHAVHFASTLKSWNNPVFLLCSRESKKCSRHSFGFVYLMRLTKQVSICMYSCERWATLNVVIVNQWLQSMQSDRCGCTNTKQQYSYY